MRDSILKEVDSMSKIRQISLLGHPILREPAEEVEDITDPLVQQIIDDMLLTVVDAKGVGIAAPQIYEAQRIFIVASRPNERYPDAPKMEPTAVINPEIIWKSEEMSRSWEGCLSIPGVRGLVPRSRKINVRYTTRDGEVVEREYSGFIARIFQHEFDHLEGLVFFDRLESTRDIVMEKEYHRVAGK